MQEESVPMVSPTLSFKIDPAGIFSKMVQQTGKQEAVALLEAAKQVGFTPLSL